MKLDPAIAKLLSLDAAKSTVAAAGGGGCSAATTLKITSKPDNGSERCYFMKTGKGKDAQVMFEGEHASLNALHDAVSSLCPKSYGHGQCVDDPSTSFLVTEYLNLSRRRSGGSESRSGKTPSLATKLAKLHTSPAPTPEGFQKPMFGFPVTTCCGDTPQDNTLNVSWADFYANSRLRFILERSELSNGKDGELHNLVQEVASKVVPRLLGDDHLKTNGKPITPVAVHGDLWSGNAGRGIIVREAGNDEGDGGMAVQDVVYDPSACYAHSEFELGIMKMFGGFGPEFLNEYHQLCPKTEPVAEYDDRIALYELYHHLNHHVLFGGGYKSGAVSIMRRLLGKYS